LGSAALLALEAVQDCSAGPEAATLGLEFARSMLPDAEVSPNEDSDVATLALEYTKTKSQESQSPEFDAATLALEAMRATSNSDTV